MPMGALAKSIGLREPNASSHLRALNARGLISAERRGVYVFYRAVPNPNVEQASVLLGKLKQCHENAEPFAKVVRLATAFTHPRRIDIVRTLAEADAGWAVLSVKTQISPQSLYRHVRKLTDRGFAESVDGLVRLTTPTHPLAVALLQAALA